MPPTPPQQHAEAVDHRGVRVGADAGVGGVRPEHAVHGAVVDDLREVLDVDLVHDARPPRRDDLEVVERSLTPAQELVALAVALVLDLDVALDRVRAAEQVGDDRVVDDHLGRRERVDLVRVAAEGRDGLAHGSEVDDAGNAGEVLHDHARGRELDLGVGLGRRVPRAERSICAFVTFAPSSVRSRFSRRTLRLNGSFSYPGTVSIRKIS